MRNQRQSSAFSSSYFRSFVQKCADGSDVCQSDAKGPLAPEPASSGEKCETASFAHPRRPHAWTPFQASPSGHRKTEASRKLSPGTKKAYEAEGGKGRQRNRLFFFWVRSLLKLDRVGTIKHIRINDSTCWEDFLAQRLKRRGSRATRRFEVKDAHPSVGGMRQQRNVHRNDFP